jgi:hypothetical protein
MTNVVAKPRYQSQQLLQGHRNLDSGQIRYVRNLFDARSLHVVSATLSTFQRTRFRLSAHLRDLIGVGRLDPLSGLIADVILLHPLIHSSAAASRD